MNPQTLLFYLSPKSAYREVLISENEVFCSPDDEDRIVDGKFLSLKTPVGSFDVAAILDRLPASQQPELVVVKLDATGRIAPRGLAKLRCPKVLVLGDSHHLRDPIGYLIEYARKESYDFILSDHDRHHLHWFRRAGFGNVHWIPSLNYRLDTRPVTPPAYQDALFIGQLGNYHIYRKQLFSALRESGAPLSTGLVPPDQTADHYAQHAVSLNCSLNGDLNLRVFEIMGSGGLLLTDRISADSGLYDLFRVGEEFDVYGSLAELRERVLHYIGHPEEALAMRQRGFDRVLAEHRPEMKRAQLMDLVFRGRELPELKLSDRRFVALSRRPARTLDDDVDLYQRIQDMHRVAASVRIYATEAGRNALAYVEDLPRLEWPPISEAGDDFDAGNELSLPVRRILFLDASIGRELARETLCSFTGDSVLLGDDWIDLDEVELRALAEELGFAPVADGSRLFGLSRIFVATDRWLESGKRLSVAAALDQQDSGGFSYDGCIEAANIALSLERSDLVERYLVSAVRQDRSARDAYLMLARIALESERYRDGYERLLEAAALGDTDDELEQWIAQTRPKVPESAFDVSSYLSSRRRERASRSAVTRRIVWAVDERDAESPFLSRSLELAGVLVARGHDVTVVWLTDSVFCSAPLEWEAIGNAGLDTVRRAVVGSGLATLIEREGRDCIVDATRDGLDLVALPYPVVRYDLGSVSKVALSLSRHYRLYLPSRDKLSVFVLIGRDTASPDGLFRAVRRLTQANVAVELLLLLEDASGDAGQSAIARVEELGLDEATRAWALDVASSIPSAMARANVCFVTAEEPVAAMRETLLAQASGLAVFLNRSLSPSLDLKDGIDVVYCDRENDLEIAQALAALLSNQRAWNDLAERGRERAAARSVARLGLELEKTVLESGPKVGE